MARVRKERKIRAPRITVIGEGETERCYFEHLRKIMGYQYDCKPRFFSHQSIAEMRKLIGRIVVDGGLVVCVFDVDVTRANHTEEDEYMKMLADFGDIPEVLLCPSMPSIEFWFLLHFLNTNKYYESSRKVVNVLRGYLSFEKNKNYLERIQWVEKLCKEGSLELACKRAESFGRKGESFTDIYKAIRLFEEQSAF